MASPEELYVRARKCLAPNGILVISTPNESGWAARVQRDKWHGYNDEEHINVYTKAPLESEVRRSGFEIIFSGSSWFSGFAIVRNSPLRILNDICYLLFGYRPWKIGDSVVVVAKPVH